MAKWSHHEDYWTPEQPMLGDPVPSIPPRPPIAEPFLPSKSKPNYMACVLVLAVGSCLWAALVIGLVLR